MAKHLLHLKSSKVNTEIVDGAEVQKPSLPRPNQLENGEIAINYAKDYERLSIKNSNGEIVTFLPDHVFFENQENVNGEIEDLKNETNEKFEALTQEIIDNEEVISSSLNDLNSRIENIDIPDVSDELENLENQITNINNNVTNLGDTVTNMGEDISGINERLEQTEEEITNIKQTIIDNEEVVSSALNDLNSRIENIDIPDVSDELENLQGQINTINNVTVPNLQEGIDENDRQITLTGQSLAQTNENLANVMETVGDGDFYDSPDDLLHRVAALEANVGDIDEIKNVLSEDEKVISSALNDLNTRINNIDVPSDITDELENLAQQINTINNVTVPNLQEGIDENDRQITLTGQSLAQTNQNVSNLLETVGDGDFYDSPDDLLHRVAALEANVGDINDIKSALTEDEHVISASLNDLNDRIIDISESINDMRFAMQQKATISALDALSQMLNDLTDRVAALENV